MAVKCDFSGYATKNDVRCSDNKVIRHGAFAAYDGKTVPLVWQHKHGDVENVLGHADLEVRDDGVYAYAHLNNTDRGRTCLLYTYDSADDVAGVVWELGGRGGE